MGFDAVVYGEVKKIAREIGELALVPSNFKSDSYVDTGTFIDAVAYPKLAERFAGLIHISSLERKALASVASSSVPAMSNLVGSGSYTWRKPMSDAAGDTYLVDATYRAFKIKADGTSVTYLGNTKGLGNFSAGALGSFLSANGKFYGAVGSFLLVSTDCLDWTICKTPWNGAAFTAQVANNKLFLMSGAASNTVYYTSDGVNWTSMTMPASAIWNQVLHNGTCYVAFASSSTTGAQSTDLASWTSVTFSATVGSNAAVSGDVFLLPTSTSTATALRSTDGLTWASVALPAANVWMIQGNASGFFICTSSVSYRSTTGAAGTWTASSIPGTVSASDMYSYMRPGEGSLWMLVVPSSTNQRLSFDMGATWLAMPSVTSVNTSNVKSLAGTASCVMYVDAFSNKVMKTTNQGTSWTEISLPGGFVPSMIGYLPSTSTFIVANASFSKGYITSTDNGATWSDVTAYPTACFATNTTCYQVDLGPGKFGISYFTAASVGYAIYTEDGQTWNMASPWSGTAMTAQAPYRAAIFKDRIYSMIPSSVASAGVTTLSLYSISNSMDPSTVVGSQAATVINSAVTAANGLRAFASNNATLVMVLGATSSSTIPTISNILYTCDGFTWSVANLNGYLAYWDNVVWTGQFFVATQSGRQSGFPASSLTVAMSYDGINWELVDLSEFVEDADYASVPRNLSIHYTADGEVYVAIANVKALFRVSSQARPRIDFIPTGISGTKYVVKAK